MALSNDGVPPDRFELRVRFVCGALLGGFLGVRLVRLGTAGPTLLAVAIATGAVVGGHLARHYGDRFWRSLPWW